MQHHLILLALFAVPALSTTTKGGLPCVFPFTYDGVEYNECTDTDSYYGLWCATSEDFVNNDKLYDFCVPETSTPKPTEAATEAPTKAPTEPPTETPTEPPTETPVELSEAQSPKPLACAFPFTYKNETYEECTTVDSSLGKPWCATTREYEDGKWLFCSKPTTTDSSTETSTEASTEAAPTCVFPFTYNGESHEACTSEDSVYPWCATTSEYQEGKWIYCPEGEEVERSTAAMTTTTTVKPFPEVKCVFPFIYKGESYDKCIQSIGGYWCSTTAEYDDDYVYCRSPTYTEDGDQCALPFVYQGTTYYTCTTKLNFGRPWCSLTYNFERKFGNCAEETDVE